MVTALIITVLVLYAARMRPVRMAIAHLQHNLRRGRRRGGGAPRGRWGPPKGPGTG
jgi:hypothetical protein